MSIETRSTILKTSSTEREAKTDAIIKDLLSLVDLWENLRKRKLKYR